MTNSVVLVLLVSLQVRSSAGATPTCSLEDELGNALAIGSELTGTTTRLDPDYNVTLTIVDAGAEVSVNTCGSDYNTYLEIYQQLPGQSYWTSIVHCDDCGPCGEQATLLIELIPGTYKVSLKSFLGLYAGDFKMNISCIEIDDLTVCRESQDVRIAGRKCQANLTALAGRVEVYHDGIWGTVCDDSWSAFDAQTVCRMFGYANGNPLDGAATLQYGAIPLDRPILADDVRCGQNEGSLIDCLVPGKFAGWGQHNCKNIELAGVECGVTKGISDQGPIFCGGIVEGDTRTGVEDPTKNSSEAREHTYEFEILSKLSLEFNSCGSEFDTYLRVLKNGSTLVAACDDCGTCGTKSVLQAVLQPGKYTLLVEGSGIKEGPYSVAMTCNNGSIPHPEEKLRLADGSTPYEGLVEVFSNGAWGTVCSNNWGSADAIVACRSLGFDGGKVAPIEMFGPGQGEVVLSGVRCKGTEDTLFDCDSDDLNVCTHVQDVGIICRAPSVPISTTSSPPTNFDLRLTGGDDLPPGSGRVEVFMNDVWGTICDDNWSIEDANVVCHSLGYGDGVPHGNAFYGQGRGPILLDEIQCTGAEKSLGDCAHADAGNIDCHHSEDAGVMCSNVRNAGESGIEVLVDGVWSGVCAIDDLQVQSVADAACRQLGHTGGVGGTIPLRDTPHIGLQCQGAETNLLDCQRVKCLSSAKQITASCNDSATSSEIRLRGGPSAFEGRVEVYNPKIGWGTVCDDGFSNRDAAVVCRQLGYVHGTAVFNAVYGPGTGTILFSDVNCSGSESNLKACMSAAGMFCRHDEDVGVKCSVVKLADGTDVTNGRLQILDHSRQQWVEVCQTFSVAGAQIVCNELGLYGGRVTNAGALTRDVFWENVVCSGSEKSVVNCQHDFTTICENSFDSVGIQCGQNIRLVGGSTPLEGRVEVSVNNEFGTVCDDGWDDNDAAVVCRQLGYAGGYADSKAAFGAGDGAIHLSQVRCDGFEDTLLQCGASSATNCDHSEDAGVVCTNVRLTNGENGTNDVGHIHTNGIVEVFDRGVWTAICADDNKWNIADARVVCGQLDVGDGTPSTIPSASYFKANCHNHYDDRSLGLDIPWVGFTTCANAKANCTAHPLTMQRHCQLTCNTCAGVSNYRCSGTQDADDYDDTYYGGAAESLLSMCTHDTNYVMGCSSIAFATCTVENNVRLQDGDTSNRGRVEIIYNGRWNTICDDGWDDVDASVACRSMGYKGGRATSEGTFAPGRGPILFSQVPCKGKEQNLLECGGSPSVNCLHTEDAGVICECSPDDVDCSDTDETSTTTAVPGSVPPNGVTLRLSGGESAGEGRVEVFRQGQWGTVCNHGFTDRSASVVCQELFGGERSFSEIVSTAKYPVKGTGPIFASDINCFGSEKHLYQCSNTTRIDVTCNHASTDVGVRCTDRIITTPVTPTSSVPPTLAPGDVPVRLVGGTSQQEGRLEVFAGTTWGTVCDTEFDALDANVVCRQLGYSSGVSRQTSLFGEGVGVVHMSNLQCSGNEKSFFECPYTKRPKCQHDQDVGIICRSIFLVNGSTTTEHRSPNASGRVALRLNKVDGNVCGLNFGVEEAEVVCRELGFAGGEPFTHNEFGVPSNHSTPTYYANLECTGREESLNACPPIDPTPVPNKICDKDHPAGVVCASGVRLAVFNDTSKKNTGGRVEVLVKGVWGTVCADGNEWDNDNAVVVCRQLGFSGGKAVVDGGQQFGVGAATMPIVLDNVNCVGFEQSLLDCTLSEEPYNCFHYEDAAVICEDGKATTRPPTRPKTQTPTIPGETPAPPTMEPTSSTPPPPTLNCGSLDTSRVEVGLGNDGDTEYATGGLVVNLVSGCDSSQTILYTINSHVCKDGFTNLSAHVACFQLGYATGIVLDTPYPVNNQLLFGNISCLGNETTLTECPTTGRVNSVNYCSDTQNSVYLSCKPHVDYGVRLRPRQLDTYSPPLPAGFNGQGLVEYWDADTFQWATICADPPSETDLGKKQYHGEYDLQTTGI